MFASTSAHIATSMKKRFARYLRPHRLQWRLTQRDIAFLLGYQSASTISRIENGRSEPSLHDAFALQAIFDLAPHEGFPALFKEAEEALLRRAYDLHQRLKNNPAAAAKTKVALLNDMLARARARIDEDA